MKSLEQVVLALKVAAVRSCCGWWRSDYERCVQDGEGGRSCGCGRSECEVCVGRRGRQWLLSVVDVVVGGQMVSVSAVCRMERQAGVVVVGREQIVSALCVQNGEAGSGFGQLWMWLWEDRW